MNVSSLSTELVPVLALSPKGWYSLPEAGVLTSAKDLAPHERLGRKAVDAVSPCRAERYLIWRN